MSGLNSDGLPWLRLALASVPPVMPLLTLQDNRQRRAKHDVLLHAADRRLRLNVGGRRFETWASTLERYPDTLLGGGERERFYCANSDEYFIDRDPQFFRHVLNFYRSGKLHFCTDDCGGPYEEELDFYRISPQFVGMCCFDEYDVAVRKGASEPQSTAYDQFDMSALADRQVSRRQRLHDVFQNPNTSLAGKATFYVIAGAIVTSIVATVVETVSCGERQCGESHAPVFHGLEAVCVVLFTCEFIVRLYAVPHRLVHLRSFTTLVDLLAIVPFYLTLFFGSMISQDAMQPLVTMRAFRIFRVFKFMRSSDRLIGLGKSLRASAPDLFFISALIGLGVVIFSILIYYIESMGNADTFRSIPEAMWLGVQTMTTLGYGDVTPRTAAGQFFAALFCIAGILIIALPVPVIQMRERLAKK